MEDNTIEDEEVELLDVPDDEVIGENYCDRRWAEILKEDKIDSFWRNVAGRRVIGATGAQILSKWRICPVVEPHPQAVVLKHRFSNVEKMLNELNAAKEITEDDVTKLTELIFDLIPFVVLKDRRMPLRLKESISTYISALVRLKHAKKEKWTDMDWSTAIYAPLQNFFWPFQNRSNSVINSDHFPTWVKPDIKPDFCSVHERPFLVAEYGSRRKAATHKDLFKLLQTMRSIIRRWQIDYPKQPNYDTVYGILIGAEVVTVFAMTYDAKYDVYNCTVFLEDDARSTCTLSTSAADIFTSLNFLLTIVQAGVLQSDWENKVAGRRKEQTDDSPNYVQPAIETPDTSKKVAAALRALPTSPTRLSNNSRINSSTTDASMGELSQKVSSMDLSEKPPSSDDNRDDSDNSDDSDNNDGNDRSKHNKKTTHKNTQAKLGPNTKAPKGAKSTNVKTKQKPIDIEKLYTVNDPELFVPNNGMFVVLAELTRHARKVVQYYGAGDKFLAKLDLHNPPVEVMVLKRLGSDNKKFIHPWVTERIDGVNVTLFEWKVNKILEARLNMPQVRRIAKQVLEALADMHAIGICHGDIKFDNVIDTGSQAYLVDFNLSYEPTVYQPQLCGTMGYRAPEAIKRNFYSQKADIYAYGICVIEVLMGKRIYSFKKREKDELKIFEWIRGEVVPLIRDKKLQKFAAKCLEEGENLRPTAAELLKDEFFGEQCEDSKIASQVRQPLGNITNKVY